MKESNQSNCGNIQEVDSKQNNNSKNNIQGLKRAKTMNQYINITLDNMGFTRYHLLLFITNALFLFCEGMHEIIHIILLSMINEKHKLSHYHLAFMNSIE